MMPDESGQSGLEVDWTTLPIGMLSISADRTYHDLRHFAASVLIRRGCSPTTVQHFLGHANASMTLAVYAGLWPDSSDQIRKALDAEFGTSTDLPRTEQVPASL